MASVAVARRRSRFVADVLPVILVLAGVVIVWQAVVMAFRIPTFLLPSPVAVANEFLSSPRFYLSNTAFTLSTTIAGFFFALVLGVTLALLIVSSRVLDKVLFTLLSSLHSVPKVALAPLLVIYLGTGVTQKVVIAALIAVFTIVINTVVGLRSVDPEVLNMAYSKQASRLTILLKVRLPHALPNLFGALKAATTFTLIGAIVGEFVAGEQGLGYVILTAQGAFDTPRAFVAVVILGLVGTALFHLLAFVERQVIPWHVSVRAERNRRPR
ncbi:MAG: ABC transporter permease [Alphaproteobacteria bacterium]